MNRNFSNLVAVTWEHAVNSQHKLYTALNNSVQMIEADVVLGHLGNSQGKSMPIMAHPPNDTSDISLRSFLNEIITYNNNNRQSSRGVKLDFKTIEVFEGSLPILNEIIPQMWFPIWLNADIVAGPVSETDTVPVDPVRFLIGCSHFPDAVLSIGWTTHWGPNYRNGCYSLGQISKMIQIIKANNVPESGQAITFPVRAGIAANSQTQLYDLIVALNTSNNCTLTIWSSENDYVDVEKLRQLILYVGTDRIYLDVPESLKKSLNLDRH